MSDEVYESVMSHAETNHTIMEAYSLQHCSMERELDQVSSSGPWS